MGTRFPLALMISAVALTTGLPLAKVRRNAQAPSQMLARNTSEHTRPRASCLRTPVIRSAARLKAVIRHSVIDGKNAFVDRIENGISCGVITC